MRTAAVLIAAACLALPASSAGQPAAPDRHRDALARPEAARDLARVPPPVLHAVEAAVIVGQLLAWAEHCQPSPGARAAVDIGRIQHTTDIQALPAGWRELTVGALLATRMTLARMPRACDALAATALDGALRDIPFGPPR